MTAVLEREEAGDEAVTGLQQPESPSSSSTRMPHQPDSQPTPSYSSGNKRGQVAAALRAAKAASVMQGFPPPKDLQVELQMDIDLEKYPFGDALERILELPTGTSLAKIHETATGKDVLSNFQRRSETTPVDCLGPRGNPWNAKFLAGPNKTPEAMAQFMQAYHDYVRNVVLDNLGTDRVAIQARPTFRCHIPHCGAPGRPHRDSDYHHSVSEVNYWIPVTKVFGTNSLWSESTPGAADFRPFELVPGQLMRFYGNQVWHYTVPNETDTTRVSIDFRVIRGEEWSPAAFANFRLGAYFSVMTREGLIPNKSAEMRALQEQYHSLPPPKKQKVKKKGAPDDEDASAAAAAAGGDEVEAKDDLGLEQQ